MYNQTQAYKQAQKAGLTTREAEALVLKKSAYLIRRAMERSDDPEAFVEAWNLTKEFWSLVQMDLFSHSCPLPNQLRANLISLSFFVDKTLTQALVTEDAKDLEPIVDISLNLAEGLSGNP